MSFFDPAGVFGGGGGGGFRDPLGIFGGGRRQMSPQEIAQAQGGGGQSQRANAFGGGFGGASGYRGQGMRESDFGGPAEMQPRQLMRGPSQNQWGPGTNDPNGDIARQQNNQLAMSQGRGAEIGMPAPQGGGMLFPGVGGGPQFGGFGGGGKGPALQAGGPALGAMMQSQGGQWNQLAGALAQQQGQNPQGASGGIRRFANMGLQPSADPYGAPRRAMAGVRSGKFSGPRG